MKTFKLDSEPKIHSGFITPQGYFDDLSLKVIQRIPEKKPKIISIFTRKKTWLYAAAAIMLLALAIPMYFNLNTHWSQIDDKSIENYITYQSNLSTTDLANLLDAEDIKNISVDIEIEQITLENELSRDENLEQYLLN